MPAVRTFRMRCAAVGVILNEAEDTACASNSNVSGHSTTQRTVHVRCGYWTFRVFRSSPPSPHCGWTITGIERWSTSLSSAGSQGAASLMQGGAKQSTHSMAVLLRVLLPACQALRDGGTWDCTHWDSRRIKKIRGQSNKERKINE